MVTLEAITKILSEELDIDAKNITEDTRLDELGADSLSLVEVMMDVEEEFGLEIKEGDIENLKTVGDIINYFSNK